MKVIIKVYVWAEWKIRAIRSSDYRKDEMHKRICKTLKRFVFWMLFNNHIFIRQSIYRQTKMKLIISDIAEMSQWISQMRII
jgi:hypothetical protein